MASTLIIYLGTGSQTDYTVPFDYLKKSFVNVSLEGEELTGGDPDDTGADYYFIDNTTIRLKVAPPAGQYLTIRRYTSLTLRVVTFKDASVLKANDLDTSQLQAFHIAAEARDIINDALIQNKEDNWDAKRHRIVNVADPVDDQDAMTYGIYKNDKLGVYQSKILAVNAASRALDAMQSALKNAELVSKNTTIVSLAKLDIVTKHDTVVRLATQVSSDKQIVLEAKDFIQEVTNIEPVKDGLACSRVTWKVSLDIPSGTVITLPEGVSYVVGRKHIFVSYGGVVASSTFFNLIGLNNTVSKQISFNFSIKANTLISVWVVPLGSIDNSLYDRVKVLLDSLADLSRRVAYATDADDK